jgi:hypothetical protein
VQRVRVSSLVVQLALAGAGALEHVVDARLGNASLADQLGGCGDDPFACRAPSGVLGESIIGE